MSSIKVEKRFKSGVNLSRTNRQESVMIFSSSDFNVEVEYLSDIDTGFLKQKVTRLDTDSNDYNMTLFVPDEVTHDFTCNILLIHPYTNTKLTLPVKFTYQAEVLQSAYYSAPPVTTQAPSTPHQPEYEGMRQSVPV